MQKTKTHKAIAILMILMLVLSLMLQTAIHAANEKAVSTKTWAEVSGPLSTYKQGQRYEQAGLCTGYVYAVLKNIYGVDWGTNSNVAGLEEKLQDKGITKVASDVTGGATANMKPGDILIFKDGSTRIHCGIYGAGGLIYHNSSSRGVCTQNLADWMRVPDADKGCDRYDAYRGLASNGKAYLVKTTTNASISANNNCYSLAGAQYSVTDASSGAVVGTLTTTASGTSNTLDLPAGTYRVKETVAPKGFFKDTNTYTLTVKAGETARLDVSDKPGSDPASLLLKKFNAETGEHYTPPEAIANFGTSLENAEYTFNYYDIPSDVVNANGGIDSTTFKAYLKKQPIKKSWTFKTDEDGFTLYSDEYKVKGGELYHNENGVAVLPIGVYTFQETKAPAGFLLDDTLYVRQVMLESTGPTVWAQNMPESPEPMKRGDISLRKIGAETQQAMANVIFKITAKSNGETHYIMTDANGEASTASSWNAHEVGNKLEGLTPETGIWFGVESALDQNKGALPYDTYTIEEIETEANAGKVLFKDEFTIYRDNHVFELGNIENNEVELITEAISEDTDSRATFAKKDTVINDTVTYHDAERGKTYKYLGYIVDKTTGKTITEKSIDVKTEQSFGTFDISFTIDTSELAGHELVVCGKLLDGDITCGIHEDVNNTKQTIRVINPNLQTTAVDKETNKHISYGKDGVTIVDTTEYEDLIKGMTYRIEGVLMDKATGEPFLVDGKEVTSEKRFTADRTKDAIELEFDIKDTDLKGKSLVVYETLYWGEYKIGEHKDINSESQTVYFPAIKTSAAFDTGSKYGYAGAETTIVDTIEYTNLIPGETYVAIAQPIDKETEQPITNGDEQFATEFVANESDGTVDVEVTFDASALAGKDVVMYEDLYVVDEDKQILVGEHKDINDENQTVHFAKLETTALFDNGKNLITPSSETKITDTVKYSNVEKGAQYRIKGILMNKETNDLFRAVDLNKKATEDEPVSNDTFIKVKSDSDTIELVLVMEGWVGDVEKITAERVEGDVYKVTNEELLIPPEQEDAFTEYLFAQIFSGFVPDVYVGDELCTMEGDDTLVIPTTISEKATITYKWRESTDKDYKVIETMTDIDIDINSVKGETTFTAEDSNGTANVDFRFDSTNIDNATIVVFEEMYLVTTDENGNETEMLIADHKDINDAAQTVTVKAENEPKTGVVMPFLGIILLIGIGIGIGTVSYIAVSRRKTVK